MDIANSCYRDFAQVTLKTRALPLPLPPSSKVYHAKVPAACFTGSLHDSQLELSSPALTTTVDNVLGYNHRYVIRLARFPGSSESFR